MPSHALRAVVTRTEDEAADDVLRSADAAEREVHAVWNAILAVIRKGKPHDWGTNYQAVAELVAGLRERVGVAIASSLVEQAATVHASTATAIVRRLPERAMTRLRQARTRDVAESLSGPAGRKPVRVPILAGAPKPEQRQAIDAFFGRTVDPALVVAGSFGFDGVATSITSTGRDADGNETLTVELAGDKGFRAKHTFVKTPDGRIVAVADLVEYRKKVKRLDGTDIFLNQVKALKELGVSEITLEAAGSKNDDFAVGYKAWARMGYEGEIEAKLLDKLPADLRAGLGGRRNVQALMSLPGGKEWWEKNGYNWDGRFDLRDGSPSLNHLSNYVAERRELKNAKGKTDPVDRAFSGDVLPPPSRERTSGIVYSSGWTSRLETLSRIAPPHQLAAQVATGMANGQNVRQIAQRLRPALQGVQTSARRVARTEGMRVAHEVQMAAYDQLGDLVIGYQIHATKDGNTRHWHRDRDGTIYYKEPKPGQKGLFQMPRPPMEAPDPAERPANTPHVAPNCRCYMTPVMDLDG